MSILDVIGQALKLAYLIVSEWLGAQARQRAADEKFQADEKAFREAFRSAVSKMRVLADKENEQVGASDDWLDSKIKPR